MTPPDVHATSAPWESRAHVPCPGCGAPGRSRAHRDAVPRRRAPGQPAWPMRSSRVAISSVTYGRLVPLGDEPALDLQRLGDPAQLAQAPRDGPPGDPLLVGRAHRHRRVVRGAEVGERVQGPAALHEEPRVVVLQGDGPALDLRVGRAAHERRAPARSTPGRGPRRRGRACAGRRSRAPGGRRAAPPRPPPRTRTPPRAGPRRSGTAGRARAAPGPRPPGSTARARRASGAPRRSAPGAPATGRPG